MGSGFSKKKKQAKMMQQQMAQMQDQLTAIEVTGQAGGDLVQVTLNGDNDLTKIIIKPDAIDPDDVDGLQDLIKAAFRDASEKLKEKTSSMMPNMPGLF